MARRAETDASRTLSWPSRGHMRNILEDILSVGWRIEELPADGALPRNGLKLILRTAVSEFRYRIFCYKVTTSGRGKPHERRVEITSTYLGNVAPEPGYADVILGIDYLSKRYVGIDAKRMMIGGSTHNASSFFDREGLDASENQVIVNPRRVVSNAFPNGVEYHAFFSGRRLIDYLFNAVEIHTGQTFRGVGVRGRYRKIILAQTFDSRLFRGDAVVVTPKFTNAVAAPPYELVEALEQNNWTLLKKKRITPEGLKQIQLACEEIGSLGEQLVLNHERERLKRKGHSHAASQVRRVSLLSVGEGYDIASFEDDGVTPRYIEVKATSGNGMCVDFSLGEWSAAKRLRSQYYIVRLTNVRGQPTLRYFRNPCALFAAGELGRTASGWQLDLSRCTSTNG